MMLNALSIALHLQECLLQKALLNFEVFLLLGLQIDKSSFTSKLADYEDDGHFWNMFIHWCTSDFDIDQKMQAHL